MKLYEKLTVEIHMRIDHRILIPNYCKQGLVPALPPQKFLSAQKQGRRIKTTKQQDFVTTNIIKNYSRNNDRAFSIRHCRIEQQKNYFFVKTISDWNQLNNTIITAPSPETFRSRLAASYQK
jgi:hypothetical protein